MSGTFKNKIHVSSENIVAGLPPVRVHDPLTITIFGASGDLTHRKLIPALYAMSVHDLLLKKVGIVGFARRDNTDETFREQMREAIRKYSRLSVDEEGLRRFSEKVFYFKGDLTDRSSFERYQAWLAEHDAQCPENNLLYLSIPPNLFEPVITYLEDVGLTSPAYAKHWSRVVIEKPFGRDLESAQRLNHNMRRRLGEEQIYRIDHYLGKETVQNILSFRFANTIFEPVFNNRYVDHVQITASETVGMEGGRGAYYDATGGLRDMVQNHLLQLLGLVAMEPPTGMTAEAIRNEKVKVLQSVQTPTLDRVIRAQYQRGHVDGLPVRGYLEEDRVDPRSKTETYVALNVQLGSWRWAGVPFYLRTGKRLPARTTEIVVQFKTPPLQLFEAVQCEGDVCDVTQAQPNLLVFRIQPKEGISLKFAAKRPALQVHVESVEMDFSYADTCLC